MRPWKDVKEAMKDRVDAARAMDADAAASAAAAAAAAGSDVQLVCFGVWVRDHAGSHRKWKLRRGHTVRVLVAFFVPARPEDDTIQSGADLKLEEPYRYNLASCHQETVLCQQHTVNLRIVAASCDRAMPVVLAAAATRNVSCSRSTVGGAYATAVVILSDARAADGTGWLPPPVRAFVARAGIHHHHSVIPSDTCVRARWCGAFRRSWYPSLGASLAATRVASS